MKTMLWYVARRKGGELKAPCGGMIVSFLLTVAMLFWNLAVLTVLSTAVPRLQALTKVNKCPGIGLNSAKAHDVSITNCETPPCRLRKKTEATIEMKVTPEKNVEALITKVHAEIARIPLPFIGVDGVSACSHFFSQNGSIPVGCPLIAGQTYLYKNSFKILDVYPKVSLNIHWGLVDEATKEYLACFEVPAKIV